ncbi:DUF581 family protein [Rhynchospora pubera]|uniref:DUF581 family protein n=1 Tax=Rhynchospora pubera TaxID=906938 RepID=A0AAV8C4M1_9POAL|nr:DUF581 family protein [Rhynchospora pubera]
MLSRGKSIFHVAGDDEAIKPEDEHSKSMSELEKKSVGLQLLIEIPSHVGSVVTKTTLGHLREKTSEEPTFLKFCFLCHKELKLQMDIFMYREQGFCTVECRDQKIMIDKRNELEISTVAHHDHLHHRRMRESNIRGLTRQKGRLLVT